MKINIVKIDDEVTVCIDNHFEMYLHICLHKPK